METQEKLQHAARELYSQGARVTISAAAEHSGVSVATAYRYYSDPDKLRHDAALNDKFGPNIEDSLERLEVLCGGIEDPLERLIVAQRMIVQFIQENEMEYRMFLASSHEHMVLQQGSETKISAGGRRILLIEAAIEPLKEQLGEPDFSELVYHMMLVVGPETYFILNDLTSEAQEDIWRVNEAAIRSIYNGFMANRT